MDLGSIIQQFTGGNPPPGAHPQLGQWLQNYQAGNYDQVPHDQVQQAYQQWTQSVPPQQAQEATTAGFQQVPQQQLPGIASSLINMFQQHGLNPQAAGVTTTNPQQMSPQDLGRMTHYAQQQQPDIIKQQFQPGGALTNPLVGLALAGALAYGASRFLH
ncbi:MAG TPA: hypothetical protein VKY74_18915 [Chloroflexia bacterium]|nr:hypothetical protein [Chloroflexia bacterium]